MLEKSVWREFSAVTFSIAIVGIGLGSTLPLTALVLTNRGYGPDIIGWMIAAAALGGVLGTFATPALVARFGRRPVMMVCFLLASASVVPLQYINSIQLWMLLRALFGLAMAALFVIGESWINVLPGDAVRGRVVAIYTTSFTLFQVLGPLLTDWLSHFPDRAFLLCGLLFLLGLPGISIAGEARESVELNTTLPEAEPEKILSWQAVLGKAPVIMMGTAFFASFDSIVLSFLPLLALDHGFTQSRALVAPAIVLAGDAALQYAAGWMSDHVGRARVHQACALAVCIMLPLLPLVIALPVLWECYLFLLGGFAGAIYTLSMVESGEKFSGTGLLRISGLIGLTWNISSSAGPAATGMLMQRFGSVAMISVLWVMAGGFLILTVVRRTVGSEEVGLS